MKEREREKEIEKGGEGITNGIKQTLSVCVP